MSVCWHKNHRKWCAKISVNRRRVYLGYFETMAEAELAYNKALTQLAPLRTRAARPVGDPVSRFFLKTTRDAASGCLLWTAATDKDGYGKFQLNGGGKQTHVRAHRFAFFLAHGRWPSELALHSCDTPACVEAAHLEDGDQAKNVRDCVARGRHRSAA